MKNTNIGIANLVVSNKIKDSYLNGYQIDESKKLTSDFFDVIKNSPILQLEFKVLNNLENKHIENEIAATRYIDSNIKLFEVYTIKEIDAEREKLNKFVTNALLAETTTANYDLERIDLYNAIDTLITESLKNYNEINVDSIHESFELVLNHIRTPRKKSLDESKEIEYVDEEVLEIAINKFNQKYESLNEDDRKLFNTLVNANSEEKKQLFETYKSDCLQILEGIKRDDIREKILKSIQKIGEMKHNAKTVDDDILSLHDLKRGLL